MQRKIVVVHGVQTGDDDDLKQDDAIHKLLRQRLGDLEVDCAVEMYRYENLNNSVLDKYQKLIKLLISTPLGATLAASAIDLAGDVVISLAQGSTADKIRNALREKILAYYAAGHPTYVVAHSLGTVYSFDVINQLMRDTAYFSRDSRLNWPVLGWVTLGSPLGLGMFKATGRSHVTHLGPGDRVFPWRNYYDPNDPVVSGNIFGARMGNEKIAEAYLDDSDSQGWSIRDYPVNTGKLHLLAHVAYWENAAVGEGIRAMVAE
ncbi:MAG: hypothetical protein AB1450_01710 [Pseudomonadota bacterium]